MTIDLLSRDSALAEWLALSTICLMIGIVLSHALRRNAARAHAVLVLSMIAAVATPLISMTLGELGLGALSPLELSATWTSTIPDNLRLLPNFRGDSWSVETVFMYAWIAAAVIAVVRITLAYLRGQRIVARAAPIHDDVATRAGESAARRLGMAITPELRTSKGVSCPVIWCWGRRPVILLPEAMAPGEPDEALRAILSHELAHWTRRDHLTSALAEIGRCLLPWQPLMWWSRRRLNALSEEACDDRVIASGESPGRYAQSLLDLVAQRQFATAPGLAAIGGTPGLARRIHGILEDSRQRAQTGRLWTACAVVFTLAIIATAAAAQRRPSVVVGASGGTVDPSAIEMIAGEDSPFIVRVAPRELDLGAGPAEKPKSGEVYLVNTGDAPMTVSRVKTSCGCTSTRGIEPGESLAPGEIRTIEVVMTAPERIGEAKTKTVTFFFDGQPPLELPVHLAAVDSEHSENAPAGN